MPAYISVLGTRVCNDTLRSALDPPFPQRSHNTWKENCWEYKGVAFQRIDIYVPEYMTETGLCGPYLTVPHVIRPSENAIGS